ncbi:hypothetical protein NZD89_28885 (plasmid) [Alicyclobacillus fastidiosus]|uniref:DUF4025 domain-containing protein n=1 Tax=Alicyclobacillus fastidiosus TaxID=392011 RepID=A0ABY6ZPT6_9BACL|nr:hypothetical protein [Alicyclobacillus fastidiosus]WAH45000.1 hypothetical protein NZD89_28885 [Alicyclobacillus fastidiosus]GMA66302.1 hypothetical protein GCM10025859_67440 [Alicyclobacillus fastidiosus]
MVRLSSTTDIGKRAFKSAEKTEPRLADNETASKGISHEATLAPGLDGVRGMDDDASSQDITSGDTTTVTKLVYDEYDPS